MIPVAAASTVHEEVYQRTEREQEIRNHTKDVSAVVRPKQDAAYHRKETHTKQPEHARIEPALNRFHAQELATCVPSRFARKRIKPRLAHASHASRELAAHGLHAQLELRTIAQSAVTTRPQPPIPTNAAAMPQRETIMFHLKTLSAAVVAVSLLVPAASLADTSQTPCILKERTITSVAPLRVQESIGRSTVPSSKAPKSSCGQSQV